MAELLAVIAILGIIALIVFPAVNKAIKNSKEKSYNQQVESILSSAENWTLENMTSLSDTNDNYVTISELQQSGYLEAKKVINPKTDAEMNGCIVIKYDESYNQYTYQYKDESCSDIQVVPIIMLNGDTTITIGKGETFTDPGYSATYKEIDITSNVVVTGTVNTEEAGTYTLEYSVNYNGKSAKKYRTVNVELLYQTFREVMEPLLGTDVNNNDPDGNLRYVGADPDNYVWFNNSLWRIIGLFGDQPKIIQDELYSQDIEWDDDSNDWTTATLKTVLNSIFFNDIDTVSKSYIDQNYTWNIGAASTSELTRSRFYEVERGNTSAAGVTDSSVTWVGAVGLIYPSDYGYSTNSESEECSSRSLYYWRWYGADCKNNSWLYNSSYNQRTITSHSTSVVSQFVLNSSGYITFNDDIDASFIEDYETEDARPTLYLKPEVVIIDGTGDHDDPYILDIIF